VTMSDDNKYEVLKEEERSMEDSVARTSDRDFIVEGSEDVDNVCGYSHSGRWCPCSKLVHEVSVNGEVYKQHLHILLAVC
jgi:hypothetical protein